MQYIYQDLFYLFFKMQISIIFYEHCPSQVARHEAVPLFSPEPDDICNVVRAL
jgi:hypothetical protein